MLLGDWPRPALKVLSPLPNRTLSKSFMLLGDSLTRALKGLSTNVIVLVVFYGCVLVF
jgi:hypothetical protein